MQVPFGRAVDAARSIHACTTTTTKGTALNIVNEEGTSVRNDNVGDSNIRVIRPSLVTDNRFECFKRKGLHFVHLNARSMYHKLSELKLLVMKSKLAVLSITESWLDSSYTDASIKIDGYNLIRRDRDTHAGGICMYIREDLAYNPRVDLQNQNLEYSWVEILLQKIKQL